MTFATVLAGYSRSEVVASLVFACVFALLGYRMSHRHRMVRGVTPWRLPSAAWAAICFFLQPFGIVVELLAQATTKPAIPAGRPASAIGPFSGYPSQPLVGTGAVAGPPASADDAHVELYVGPPPPPADLSGHAASFGWYADTTTRHELRYWDGKRWSDHVCDGGVVGSDPL
jgi:hypothetical protein